MTKNKPNENDDKQDGVKGFSPQYSGTGISAQHDTSSFDMAEGTKGVFKQDAIGHDPNKARLLKQK